MPLIYQAVAFIIGVLPLTLLPRLPNSWQLLLLSCVAVLCWVTKIRLARYCAIGYLQFVGLATVRDNNCSKSTG